MFIKSRSSVNIKMWLFRQISFWAVSLYFQLLWYQNEMMPNCVDFSEMILEWFSSMVDICDDF